MSATPKLCCAITTARDAGWMIEKWVAHYGAAFGRENLFVCLDGQDQRPPDALGPVNVLRLPRNLGTREQTDRRRARLMSDIARGLFRLYDVVVCSDIDELLVLDPAVGGSLAEYLGRITRPTVSGLGLDIGQHPEREGPLDLSRPFLSQRRYAHVSARYTKPVVATRPVTWGSGMHRVKGRNFHIDPNLYLCHFGLVDMAHATGRAGDPARLDAGWKAHLDRRHALYRILAEAEPVPGDEFFATARRLQSWRRPLHALNKPGMLPGDPVVELPERFAALL